MLQDNVAQGSNRANGTASKVDGVGGGGAQGGGIYQTRGSVSLVRHTVLQGNQAIGGDGGNGGNGAMLALTARDSRGLDARPAAAPPGGVRREAVFTP